MYHRGRHGAGEAWERATEGRNEFRRDDIMDQVDRTMIVTASPIGIDGQVQHTRENITTPNAPIDATVIDAGTCNVVGEKRG